MPLLGSPNIIDGVAGLNVERDGFARQRLDKDLHTTAEPEDQVERWLLLDVVVRKRTTIF